MSEEKKKSRPPKSEWTHPPMQGHEEVPVAVKQGEANLPDSPAMPSVECPPGWFPIETAPKNGGKIVVSKTGEDRIAVFWRERRVVDKKNLRYIKESRWTNSFTRSDIDFEPVYWQPYAASYYIPQ